jgi:hypothetical protein
MALSSEIIPVEGLEADCILAMYRLLDRYYGNVAWEGFREDLREKTWVILLRDGEDLVGFSTQRLSESIFEGETFGIVFSGDTIIDPAHWGSPELQAAFAALLNRIHSGRPDRRLFWFLISKGFRTYRILPIYFKEFFPCHFRETPAWHARFLDHLARSKYPESYVPDKGILDFNGRSQYLKPPLSGIPEGKLAANPHIRFFAKANPGHARGDELACLAEFSRDNLTPFVMKRLEGAGVQAG